MKPTPDYKDTLLRLLIERFQAEPTEADVEAPPTEDAEDDGLPPLVRTAVQAVGG